MEHSGHYDQVKRYYKRVRNAVKMAWITETEFEEITGKAY